MDLGLKNKNVLITGSSRGIGRGIAQLFLHEGANVMINSRGVINDSMEGFSYVQGDVLTTEGMNNIANKIQEVFSGKLDVLICNVGSGKSVPPGSENSEEWKRVFDLNFFSTINTIESLKSFIVPDTGSIVCISSICGLEVLGAPLTYSSAKAALNAYVVGASRVFAKNGIRINAIAPGNILFDGSTWDKKLQDNKKAVLDMLEKEVALKKLGKVQDVANASAFLSSSCANFITGTIMVVDGGQVRAW